MHDHSSRNRSSPPRASHQQFAPDHCVRTACAGGTDPSHVRIHCNCARCECIWPKEHDRSTWRSAPSPSVGAVLDHLLGNLHRCASICITNTCAGFLGLQLHLVLGLQRWPWVRSPFVRSPMKSEMAFSPHVRPVTSRVQQTSIAHGEAPAPLGSAARKGEHWRT